MLYLLKNDFYIFNIDILGDFENYSMYINDILLNPDYVLEDSKNIDTILMIKHIKDKGKNLQLIVKLSTTTNNLKEKNSILTFWKIRNSTVLQLLRNKKILYKKT